MPRSLTARRCLLRLHMEGALVRLPRGFGHRGDSIAALIPARTVFRLAENGLVSIKANQANGLVTARITQQGRYLVEHMSGPSSFGARPSGAWRIASLDANRQRSN
jgi:hypothetical protein